MAAENHYHPVSFALPTLAVKQTQLKQQSPFFHAFQLQSSHQSVPQQSQELNQASFSQQQQQQQQQHLQQQQLQFQPTHSTTTATLLQSSLDDLNCNHAAPTQFQQNDQATTLLTQSPPQNQPQNLTTTTGAPGITTLTFEVTHQRILNHSQAQSQHYQQNHSLTSRDQSTAFATSTTASSCSPHSRRKNNLLLKTATVSSNPINQQIQAVQQQQQQQQPTTSTTATSRKPSVFVVKQSSQNQSKSKPTNESNSQQQLHQQHNNITHAKKVFLQPQKSSGSSLKMVPSSLNQQTLSSNMQALQHTQPLPSTTVPPSNDQQMQFVLSTYEMDAETFPLNTLSDRRNSSSVFRKELACLQLLSHTKAATTTTTTATAVQSNQTTTSSSIVGTTTTTTNINTTNNHIRIPTIQSSIDETQKSFNHLHLNHHQSHQLQSQGSPQSRRVSQQQSHLQSFTNTTTNANQNKPHIISTKRTTNISPQSRLKTTTTTTTGFNGNGTSANSNQFSTFSNNNINDLLGKRKAKSTQRQSSILRDRTLTLTDATDAQNAASSSSNLPSTPRGTSSSSTTTNKTSNHTINASNQNINNNSTVNLYTIAPGGRKIHHNPSGRIQSFNSSRNNSKPTILNKPTLYSQTNNNSISQLDKKHSQQPSQHHSLSMSTSQVSPSSGSNQSGIPPNNHNNSQNYLWTASATESGYSSVNRLQLQHQQQGGTTQLQQQQQHNNHLKSLTQSTNNINQQLQQLNTSSPSEAMPLASVKPRNLNSIHYLKDCGETYEGTCYDTHTTATPSSSTCLLDKYFVSTSQSSPKTHALGSVGGTTTAASSALIPPTGTIGTSTTIAGSSAFLRFTKKSLQPPQSQQQQQFQTLHNQSQQQQQQLQLQQPGNSQQYHQPLPLQNQNNIIPSAHSRSNSNTARCSPSGQSASAASSSSSSKLLILLQSQTNKHSSANSGKSTSPRLISESSRNTFTHLYDAPAPESTHTQQLQHPHTINPQNNHAIQNVPKKKLPRPTASSSSSSNNSTPTYANNNNSHQYFANRFYPASNHANPSTTTAAHGQNAGLTIKKQPGIKGNSKESSFQRSFHEAKRAPQMQIQLKPSAMIATSSANVAAAAPANQNVHIHMRTEQHEPMEKQCHNKYSESASKCENVVRSLPTEHQLPLLTDESHNDIPSQISSIQPLVEEKKQIIKQESQFITNNRETNDQDDRDAEQYLQCGQLLQQGLMIDFSLDEPSATTEKNEILVGKIHSNVNLQNENADPVQMKYHNHHPISSQLSNLVEEPIESSCSSRRSVVSMRSQILKYTNSYQRFEVLPDLLFGEDSPTTASMLVPNQGQQTVQQNFAEKIAQNANVNLTGRNHSFFKKKIQHQFQDEINE